MCVCARARVYIYELFSGDVYKLLGFQIDNFVLYFILVFFKHSIESVCCCVLIVMLAA